MTTTDDVPGRPGGAVRNRASAPPSGGRGKYGNRRGFAVTENGSKSAPTDSAEDVFAFLVKHWGEVPEGLRADLGLNADGTAGPGGLTEDARKFAMRASGLVGALRRLEARGVPVGDYPGRGWREYGAEDVKAEGGIAGERVDQIFAEAKEAAALRVVAEATGGFDAEDCASYGVSPDGTIGEAGLTAEGKKFAEVAVQAVKGAVADMRAERARGRKSRTAEPAGNPIGDLLGALEMAGPIRAAIRAGARALAVALDDGVTDDAPGGRVPGGTTDAHDHSEDGACLRTVTLGDEPFVLIRATRIPGMPAGVVTIAAGGGAMYERQDGSEDAPITVEKMLTLAAEGNARTAERGAPPERRHAMPAHGEAVDEVIRRLGGAGGGIDVEFVEVSPDGSVVSPGAAAEARLREAMFGAADRGSFFPQGSGAGPSTEAPSMPNMPDPRPATETRESPAAPSPTRDDQDRSSSSPSDSGSAGPSGGSE